MLDSHYRYVRYLDTCCWVLLYRFTVVAGWLYSISVLPLYPERFVQGRCAEFTLSSDHEGMLLRDAIHSRHRPLQNDTTIYQKPDTSCGGILTSFHSIRIASRYSHQVCLSSSDEITFVMDEIDTFFASFPTFQYRRNASSPQEFRRVCQFFGWRKDPNDMYPIE